ncbi:uncharacterized protein LOC125212054 isoform X2 [Salvia hispanica]|uniref:uncharacterized protein LOC125212054 isoform X2 n=1 Tax=Salvia hispanica TaxID=49212 RepID=UPI002009B0E6|nr:uncharacterized protein LOC125212054 isoform X2 [Salvia hispanica]
MLLHVYHQDMTEVNGRASHCNENRCLQPSTSRNEQKKAADNSPDTSRFVNHASIEWEESRRKWTGDISQGPRGMQNDPIISWSTTYEDLLSTNDPFPKPIPLPEMVDFLVDTWHDEGLFD